MTARDRVLIVGGGPAGLTVALRLATRNIPVLLVEAEAAIPRQLRASTLHPPTLDMLDRYGIGRELVRLGRITPSWQVRWQETGEKAEFDLSVLRDDTAHPYRLQCEQWRLCELLLERLAGLPAAEIRFATRAVTVGQSGEGVWIEAEGKQGRERLDGRFLVGCEGGHSLVREAIGARFEGSTYPETTLLVTTTFPFEEAIPGLAGVNYIWKQDGTFSLLRLPRLWRCSFHPRPDETPEEALGDASIRRHLEAVVPGGGAIEVIERRPYRVHRRLADRWRRGRMLIAGDAAHLNNPKGGMGMNGGIHDAFELTDCLAAVYAGGDEAILDRYERRRLPVVRDDIIAQADANRARMNETDPESRRASLRRLQEIAGDPGRCHAFLLRSSMIDGLRRAAAVQ